MKPKIAPFFRNSSRAQKDEETIHRQIDGFEQRWPELSKTYDLFERVPGGKRQDQYFADEAFNLETWDESTNFCELMNLCRTRQINAIYVSEDNRLFRSRSSELKGRIIDLVRNNNVKVIARDGEVQPGLLMEIRSAMGTEDKRAFMYKCHEAKITRINKEGRPPTGRMPFCFHWDKREQRWSLIETEVRLLKCAVGLSIGKIFDEMTEEVKNLVRLNPGGLNDRAVAEELSRLGFSKHPFYERINLSYMMRNRANPDLKTSAIEKMFREDRYRGVLEISMLKPEAVGAPEKTSGDRNVYKISVPPVLSDEDWGSLQAKRRVRRKWAVHNLKYEYLCKDLLICTECGIPLAARPRRIKKYIVSRKEEITLDFFYYTCARKPKVTRQRCRSGKHHKVETIDDLVWTSFVDVIQNPEKLKSLLDAGESDETRVRRKKDLEKIIQQHESEIKELKNRRQRANRLLANGVIEEEDYTQQIQNLKTRHAQLEEELQNAESEIRAASKGPDMGPIAEALAGLDLSGKDVLSFEQRRDLLRALVSKIQISNLGEIAVLLKGGIEWAV